MPDSVSLPFCVPWFAYTHIHAAPGIAIAQHPTGYNGYLNQCTTLECNRQFLMGFSSPQISLSRAGLYAFNFLERYPVSLRFTQELQHTIIKRMLNAGFYIHFNCVDDYYLPGKSWYGVRHFEHDGIICGYDETDKTYSIAAYDSNWIFSLIRVPQSCFADGVNARFENNKYCMLTAYRANTNWPVELNEKMILQYLKEYLENTFDKFPLDQLGKVEGIAVQDFIVLYLDKIKDGSIPIEKIDWRIMRPVWEHKRCMLDRIKAIEELYGWDSKFSSQYAPLVEDSNRIRMMYAMYCKTHKESLLDKVQKGIIAFKEKEEEILKEFVKRMEGEQS